MNDIATIVPEGAGTIKSNLISGDVILDDFTAVGANAVIMPNNHLPIGAAIGALSFVPVGFDFKQWSVYAGIPIRFIGPRNRESVLAQAEKLKTFLQSKA
jgi:acetyltransferase-like isoleucine patch superfamily enzyme